MAQTVEATLQEQLMKDFCNDDFLKAEVPKGGAMFSALRSANNTDVGKTALWELHLQVAVCNTRV